MKAAKDVVVRFLIDSKTAEKNVDSLNNHLKQAEQAGNNNNTVFGKLQSMIGRFGASVGQVNPQLGSMITKYGATAIKVVALTAAIAGLSVAMKSMVAAGIDAETQFVKLGVVLGDAAAGVQAYEDALQYSVKTPFDPRAVAEATAIAQGYLGDMGTAFQDQIFGINGDIMTLAGDMAAFSGQSIQEATTALMRGDLALLDKYGAVGRRAYMDAKKVAELGTPQFIESFVQNMREIPQLQDMALKQATTMGGLFSTIAGYAGLFWTYMSGALEDAKGQNTFWTKMKAIVGSVAENLGMFLNYARPFLVEFGSLIGNVFATIVNMLKAVVNIAKPILIPVLKVIGALLYAAIIGLNKVFEFITWILQKATAIGEAIMRWVDATYGISKAVDGLFNVFERLFNWFERMHGYLQTIGFFEKTLWEQIKILVFEVGDGMLEMGEGMANHFMSGINQAIDKIMWFFNETIPGKILKRLASDGLDLLKAGGQKTADFAKWYDDKTGLYTETLRPAYDKASSGAGFIKEKVGEGAGHLGAYLIGAKDKSFSSAKEHSVSLGEFGSAMLGKGSKSLGETYDNTKQRLVDYAEGTNNYNNDNRKSETNITQHHYYDFFNRDPKTDLSGNPQVGW
ncbi:MAG: hypothetical protein PF637_06060 [Spirochaetes bacterium]|jgi:hypothetical protein|nr:hypothetical protein [Spirochaetota bacterium]